VISLIGHAFPLGLERQQGTGPALGKKTSVAAVFGTPIILSKNPALGSFGLKSMQS
jgi:hypothetical protein